MFVRKTRGPQARREEDLHRRRVYRVLLVGAGAVAGRGTRPGGRVLLTHAPAIEAHRRFSLAGLVEPHPGRRKKLARRFGIARTWPSLAPALRARWDLVVVASPTPLHARQVRAALAAGVRAILCEKPLAASSREARALLSLARARRATLLVHYPRRYALGVERAIRALRAGRFGKIREIHAWYGGKGLRHLGIHQLDLLADLLGPPDRVRAIRTRHGRAGDPAPLVRLAWRSGAGAVLQPYPYEDFAHAEITILTSKGLLRIEGMGDRIVLAPATRDRVHGAPVVRTAHTAPTDLVRATKRLYDRLADLLDRGARAVEPHDDRLLAVCEAAARGL